jgi:hypothetical protein
MVKTSKRMDSSGDKTDDSAEKNRSSAGKLAFWGD